MMEMTRETTRTAMSATNKSTALASFIRELAWMYTAYYC
jgi:hypothetical protein